MSPKSTTDVKKKNAAVNQKKAADLQQSGAKDVLEAADKLSAAQDASTISRVMLAGGARDLARGADAENAANVAKLLSQVVAEAGVSDMARYGTRCFTTRSLRGYSGSKCAGFGIE